jgi:hypothetical protein
VILQSFISLFTNSSHVKLEPLHKGKSYAHLICYPCVFHHLNWMQTLIFVILCFTVSRQLHIIYNFLVSDRQAKTPGEVLWMVTTYQDMVASWSSSGNTIQYLTSRMEEARIHHHSEIALRMDGISQRISGLSAILHTRIGQFPQWHSHLLHLNTKCHYLLEFYSQGKSVKWKKEEYTV